MIKRYFALIIVVATAMMLRAERVSLSVAEGHPGDEVTVTMSMDGGSDVCAIEMTLPLGDNLTYIAESAATTDRTSSHSISASVRDGALRMVIYNVTLSPIQGDAGDIATFRLRLGDKPGAVTLTPTLTLSNEEGDSIGASVESGSVTVNTPELTIVTSQINYGHIPIRSTYTKNITLRNSGNEPLEVYSLTPADAEVLSVAPQSFTIAPGASQNAVVTFAPTVRGAYSSEIEVDCNAVNNLVYNRHQKVQVVADPFSVNELHILRAEGVSDSEAEVFVRVNNMEPLVGAQFSLTLPNALKYVDGSVKTLDRTAGSSVTASVDGNKLKFLLYSLSNTPFEGEDGNILSFKVTLDGRSGSYRLNPANVILSNVDMENMVSASYGEYVVIQSPTISTSNSCDFGKQDITTAITQELTVRNTGQIPLVIDRISFLSEGYSVVTPLPLSIARNQSATITIKYEPEALGEFSTIMNIYSNDPEMRVKQVSIYGEAYSPNTISLDGSYDWDRGYMVNVNLSNHYPISALQFDLVAEDAEAVASTASLALSERMTGFSGIVTRVEAGRYRVLAYVISNNTVATGDGRIITITIPCAEQTPAANTFTIENIILSSPESRNMLTPDFAAPTATIIPLPPGDADGDGEVNVKDIQRVLNIITGRKIPQSGEPSGDVNDDGQINVKDIQRILNIITGRF